MSILMLVPHVHCTRIGIVGSRDPVSLVQLHPIFSLPEILNPHQMRLGVSEKHVHDNGRNVSYQPRLMASAETNTTDVALGRVMRIGSYGH
jgi:hypothetical protein